MHTPYSIKEKLLSDGFAIAENVFTDQEIDELILVISQANICRSTLRKTDELFAIRQFFKEVPTSVGKVFTDSLNNIISNLFGEKYFVVKSIYFD